MSTPGVASAETRTQAGRHASAYALPTELCTVLHSTLISSPRSKYLNIQTEILAFNLNINIPRHFHSSQYNAKPLNANI
jgi:hypothetical protein